MQRGRLLAVVGALSLVIPTTIAHADESADSTTLKDLVATASPQAVRSGAADLLSVNQGRVTVMVEVEGDPVAVVEAEQGHLTKAEETSVEERLKKLQDTLTGRIEKLGGVVESRMQSAYNGMRVTIDGSNLDALRELPGVKAVHAVPTYERTNVKGSELTGVPMAWQGTGAGGHTGKGVKVAVIDTGVDYTHATFGGPGTKEAFDQATAASDGSALYGPRFKGGIDLVGDAYTGDNTPVPDANPIDCIANGHGTHVAGTAAGSGVTVDGRTYTGSYDAETLKQDFLVGPGSAPEADLYAVKVFGCSGSTNVVVEAIDWAVKNDMDVINMSLGSDYGREDEPDAVAAANAVASGVVVVTASGNSGHQPYLTGSPAVAPGVVGVAASDARRTILATEVTVGGEKIDAINANGVPLANPAPLHVLKDAQGGISLGCKAEDYAGIPQGAVVVTRRGDCARVVRAILGQQAGAAAVIMVNTESKLPPFEGPITSNPDTGEAFNVTIPFIGVAKEAGGVLLGLEGQSVTASDKEVPNPTYTAYADFTSSGPRTGDSWLRPNVTAPGVSVLSAAVGAGTHGLSVSGTSMATPHVAGIAALAVQAHPDWDAQQIAAALVSTTDSSKVSDYDTVIGGGLVNPAAAVATSVYAYGDATKVGDKVVRDASVSFGYAEVAGTHSDSRTITVENKGDSDATFKVSVDQAEKSLKGKVSVTPSTVTVPAGGQAEVTLAISVDAGDVPAISESDEGGNLHHLSGNVRFTRDEGPNLAVPYLLVTRSLSEVTATATSTGTDTGRIELSNASSAHAGDAMLFTWGLTDPEDIDDVQDTGTDLASVGVQSFEDGGKRYLAFATNMHSRFSNPASIIVETHIDVDGDKQADHVLFSADQGKMHSPEANGIAETFLLDLKTKQVKQTGFMTLAPTDSSTLITMVDAADLGSPARISYNSVAYRPDGSGQDTFAASADHELGNRPFEDARSVAVPKGGQAGFDLTINRPAVEAQQPLGWMVVVLDNAQGVSEALTGVLPKGADPEPSPTPTTPPSPAPSSPAPTVPVRPTPPPVAPGLPSTGTAR
ncbi:S8 family serine peptidase [Arachnia propionica]|uniref:S8 family peptidase n=1 Tax=Arachnia propionica TaxID=1750 RepID=UPI0026883AA4|nr:S8 family serine peptidase [Arachnia propionica]